MSKMTIKCNRCGLLFEQTPNNHLRGSGCPKCNNNSINNEEYLKLIYEKYGNQFTCLSEYKNYNTKVKIRCNNCFHEFIIHPFVFLKTENPCKICNKNKADKKQIKRTGNLLGNEKFLIRAREIHGDKYIYPDDMVYKGIAEPLKIICRIHGEFWQKPREHFNKCGCQICGNEKNNKRWEDTHDSGLIYLIRCWNETENFLKIGITSKTVEERFLYNIMPYNYELIESYNSNSKHVLEIEDHIIDICESYIPKIKFGGYTECLNIDEKEYILHILKSNFII